MSPRHRRIADWIQSFGLCEGLSPHVLDVLDALPDAVRNDVMDDPLFRLFDYEPNGATYAVLVGAPSGMSQPSRCVALKRTLANRPVAFARYVIAHELAHAFLRNAGRWPDDDPEHAADALAAEWGFPRP